MPNVCAVIGSNLVVYYMFHSHLVKINRYYNTTGLIIRKQKLTILEWHILGWNNCNHQCRLSFQNRYDTNKFIMKLTSQGFLLKIVLSQYSYLIKSGSTILQASFRQSSLQKKCSLKESKSSDIFPHKQLDFSCLKEPCTSISLLIV